MRTDENGLNKLINELELPKNVKNSIRILTWIIPITLISLIIYTAFFESHDKKRAREINATLENTFNGIVKEKFISRNHNTPTTKLHSGIEIGSDYGLYNLVQINDSISKEEGILYVKIYRKNDDKSSYMYFDKEYLHFMDRKFKTE